MVKIKKYYLLLLTPLMFLFFTLSFTSCDPHRSGSVIKGRGAKTNYHSRPASGKAPRKNKY